MYFGELCHGGRNPVNQWEIHHEVSGHHITPQVPWHYQPAARLVIDTRAVLPETIRRAVPINDGTDFPDTA